MTERCFYTGVILKKAAGHSGRTVEHLIPKSAKKINNSFNKVHAASYINVIVGNAPLIVKFSVRDYIQKLDIADNIPFDDNDEYITFCGELIKLYMKKKYQVKQSKRYPWDWKAPGFPRNMDSNKKREWKNNLKELYMGLLTPEEKQLNAYIK